MRFHILGVNHAKTHREYSVDAFSQKIRLLCKMLTDLGHTVYHYGTEGSNPECTENIDVQSDATYKRVHNYDWRTTAFNCDRDNDSYREYFENAVTEVGKRCERNDFILCPFGLNHKPVADALSDRGLIVCEPGIGYEFTFAPHRVFESYPWMHYLYGKEGNMLKPPLYDAVIPNYYDLNDYPFSDTKDNYFIMLGRPTHLKGWEIAALTSDAVGIPLITAGQGEPPFKAKNHTHLGVISIEERGELVSRAKLLFAPTIYLEPFGGVVIEASLCGTPVLSTDFGAFSDTVLHGYTGYRCRTLEQFIWAAKNIDLISPRNCRNYSAANYSLERISKMYEEYFSYLHRLYTSPGGWYQKNPKRMELDWLTKCYEV